MINTSLFDLTGKVALLTGASKGMGKSMAEGLAEHGAKVVVSSRKFDQCEETAAQINENVERAGPFPLHQILVIRINCSHLSTKHMRNLAKSIF